MRYLEGYDVCELGELAVVVDFDLFLSGLAWQKCSCEQFIRGYLKRVNIVIIVASLGDLGKQNGDAILVYER